MENFSDQISSDLWIWLEIDSRGQKNKVMKYDSILRKYWSALLSLILTLGITWISFVIAYLELYPFFRSSWFRYVFVERFEQRKIWMQRSRDKVKKRILFKFLRYLTLRYLTFNLSPWPYKLNFINIPYAHKPLCLKK